MTTRKKPIEGCLCNTLYDAPCSGELNPISETSKKTLRLLLKLVIFNSINFTYFEIRTVGDIRFHNGAIDSA